MASYLLDTNVLLRLVLLNDREHLLVRDAVDVLWENGARLVYTSQNLAELWNIFTRPANRNGAGFTVAEADKRALLIEQQFELVPQTETIHWVWRKLLVEYQVSGVQVHDARLVASMLVHQIDHLLTLNGKDFRRYRGINVVSPGQVLRNG